MSNPDLRVNFNVLSSLQIDTPLDVFSLRVVTVSVRKCDGQINLECDRPTNYVRNLLWQRWKATLFMFSWSWFFDRIYLLLSFNLLFAKFRTEKANNFVIARYRERRPIYLASFRDLCADNETTFDSRICYCGNPNDVDIICCRCWSPKWFCLFRLILGRLSVR